jgi:hypothetical protein
MKSVSIRQLPRAAMKVVTDKLNKAALAEVLVSNAQRRMENGGDSEHTYPDLWGGGYRSGGQPLLDTRQTIYNQLNGEQRSTERAISLILRGPMIAMYHQTGFSTNGPNFIPLTTAARTLHVIGNDPKEEGLVEGEDYIMAWQGVTVPQRKIHNTPREDVNDLRDTIADALR